MDSKYHDRRRTCVCHPQHRPHRDGRRECPGGHKPQRLHCKRYNQGYRSHENLAASMEKPKINTNVKENIPSASPIKQNATVRTGLTLQRYLENMYLLGMAWVRKVQHIARLTLNSPTGPVWPTYIEPLALELFGFLQSCSIDWTRVRERADFADEIDLVWRVNPLWLPDEHKRYIPIWEYVTGTARTWGWNWYNEARKRGATEEVWRREDGYPRSRDHQNKGSASRHHELADLRVPTIANSTGLETTRQPANGQSRHLAAATVVTTPNQPTPSRH